LLFYRQLLEDQKVNVTQLRHGHMTANVADVAVVLLLPVWDCTSYDCLGF